MKRANNILISTSSRRKILLDRLYKAMKAQVLPDIRGLLVIPVSKSLPLPNTVKLTHPKIALSRELAIMTCCSRKLPQIQLLLR